MSRPAFPARVDRIGFSAAAHGSADVYRATVMVMVVLVLVLVLSEMRTGQQRRRRVQVSKGRRALAITPPC